MTESLDLLAARVRDDLAHLSYPLDQGWTVPRHHDGHRVVDVLIVGGGQSGLSIAFSLRLERITNVLIVDRASSGQEGPWRRYARMHELRTPKWVTGPDCGIPSLTPRAWYEARFGRASWDAIERIPRELWSEYIDWYRTVLALPVENGTEVLAIKPSHNLLGAQLSTDAGPEMVLARKIVLATGLDGCGSWSVPEMIAQALPERRYAHTGTAIDFVALKNRRVAVLGAGASAFDAAGTALEAGAMRVDLFCRQPDLPRINPLTWMSSPGFLGHFHALDDAQRWRFGRHVERLSHPPPQLAVDRCRHFANFAIRLGEPWLEVVEAGDQATIRTRVGTESYDFVVLGTGIQVDFSRRQELAEFAAHIALWRDRYTPPEDERCEELAAQPYLGSAYNLVERAPGCAPFLKDIHVFSLSANASLGLAGGITGLRYGLRRLTDGIVRDLFVGDAESHYAAFLAYRTPEIHL